jgi:hypothetical protein
MGLNKEIQNQLLPQMVLEMCKRNCEFCQNNLTRCRCLEDPIRVHIGCTHPSVANANVDLLHSAEAEEEIRVSFMAYGSQCSSGMVLLSN